MMRQEDIRGNEDRSQLLKVLGAESTLNIKKRYQPIDIRTGDAFLICSDGFWEYVFETEMEMDLLKSDSAEIWLKYMLKRHILRAENKGDNYTAICGIIHLDGGEVPVTSKAIGISGSEPDVPRKKSLLLPLIIAGAVIIAAAACLVFFLDGGNGSSIPDSTQNSYSTSESSSTSVFMPPSGTSSEPSVSEPSGSETLSEPTTSEASSIAETSETPAESETTSVPKTDPENR